MRSYEFESQAQVAFNAFNLAKPWALVKIPDDITPLVQFIKSNCTPWLSLKTRTPLYRGISHHGSGHKAETAFILPVRKDRKPLDSTVGMHKVFNQLIAMAGGTANRSNSMFTTPVYSNAILHTGWGSLLCPLGSSITLGPTGYMIGTGNTRVRLLLISSSRTPWTSKQYTNHCGPRLRVVLRDPSITPKFRICSLMRAIMMYPK